LEILCPTSKFKKTMTKGIWTLLTWWFLNIWNPKSNMCHFNGSRYPKFEETSRKVGHVCWLGAPSTSYVDRSMYIYISYR
jgi:hypothetical protein